jgi:hypothetical protein
VAKAVRYEKTLRAIGQNLESLAVDSFALEMTGDRYIVQGEFKKSDVTRAPEPVVTKSFLGFIRNVGKKRTTQNSEPQTCHFSVVHFTEADIELLDQKGRLLRAKSDDCALNPQSVAQVLRTAAADLDHKKCRPLKLSWCHQTLTLVHVNGHGVERTETYMPADLYNLWVHQFKQRSKPTGAG